MDTPFYADWPTHHTGVLAPAHFKRVECKTLQKFCLEFLKRKRAKHRLAHLRDLRAHSIGFVDVDGEAWVLIMPYYVHESPAAPPKGVTGVQWDVFTSYIKTWKGRDMLFGEHPEKPIPPTEVQVDLTRA